MLPKKLQDPLAEQIKEGTTSGDVTRAARALEESFGASGHEDGDGLVQGLDPHQIRLLAEKIYDLLLDELRLEQERHGRSTLR